LLRYQTRDHLRLAFQNYDPVYFFFFCKNSSKLSHFAELRGSFAEPNFQLLLKVSPRPMFPECTSASSIGKYSSKCASIRCSSMQVATAILKSAIGLEPNCRTKLQTTSGSLGSSSPAAIAPLHLFFEFDEARAFFISEIPIVGLSIPLGGFLMLFCFLVLFWSLLGKVLFYGF
jgi:hypothetical protein